MREATNTILGLIVGCGLAVSGCFPQPTDRELFEWTHFTYSEVTLPDGPRVRGGAADAERRAEADLSQPAHLAESREVQPAAIDAVFESNAVMIRHCVRTSVPTEEARPGAVWLRFRVSSTGQAEQVVVQTVGLDADLGRCVAESMTHWRFPADQSRSISVQKAIVVAVSGPVAATR